MKRFLFSIFALIITFNFQSCSEDESLEIETPTQKEDPTPVPEDENGGDEDEEETKLTTYFTMELTPGYNSAHTEYLLIYNTKGKLLGHRQIIDGADLIFQAHDSIQITDLLITKLEIRETEGFKSSSLETYGPIPKGRTWKYGYVSGESTIPSANFNLRVENIPNWQEYNLRNKTGLGSSVASRFLNVSNDPNYDYLELTNVELYEENDYFLSIIDQNSKPKYKWLNSVNDGDNIVIDGAIELADFDQYSELDIPIGVENFSYVTTAQAPGFDYSFIVSLYGHDPFTSLPSSYRIGYLNSLENFKTSITYTFRDYTYNYSIFDDKINKDDLNFSEPTLTITDEKQGNFSFTSNINYNYRTSIWSKSYTKNDLNLFTNWSIKTTSDLSLPELSIPSEISNLNPEVEFKNLDYKRTTFQTRGLNWDDIINVLFKDKEKQNNAKVTESIVISK